MALVDRLDHLTADLVAAAEPDRAPEMRAYMRDRFDFLGVPAPARRRLSTELLRAAKTAPAAELVVFADACWAAEHRELQYVATDALRAGAARLRPADIDHLQHYLTTKSWWDTVDLLAAWVVGPLVLAHPHLVAVMDRWIDDGNLWLARTAIIHQLSYKGDTDGDRLFRYAETRADDTDFFLRKAIGWALRQYAREEPERVRSFVESNRDRLSGLTVREALKHLGRSGG